MADSQTGWERQTRKSLCGRRRTALDDDFVDVFLSLAVEDPVERAPAQCVRIDQAINVGGRPGLARGSGPLRLDDPFITALQPNSLGMSAVRIKYPRLELFPYGVPTD